MASQAFGNGLRRGCLPITGQASGRCEVGRTGDLISAGVLTSTLHFNVAQDQNRPSRGSRGGDFDECRRISDGEPQATEEGRIGVRNTCHQNGSVCIR